ncbi:MAG: SurA N-terminal domain-containing protein [Desulfobacterales bacterium]|nr:SurA N-terminal domain-containing protein [Desulfobacterales bacterium]MBF0396984.1 SurA N-terminal domain-containing protein [Desulfobacterales bacterium]
MIIMFRRTILFLLIILVLIGCKNQSSKLDKEYLLKIGDQVITVEDFKNALEIAKTTYPYKMTENPEILKTVAIYILNQLREEIILLERAKELSISISDNEFKKAVDSIKKDYPNDYFEKVLVEYAISYKTWKHDFMRRMLIEKVIEKELIDKVTIYPDDITSYYRANYENTTETKDLNEIIVKALRKQKAQENYDTWIKNLKDKYKVEVNDTRWKRIVGAN